jgi:dimethylargininase
MRKGCSGKYRNCAVTTDDHSMNEGFSYRFTDAIVREPGRSVTGGLRAADRGAPDIGRFTAEHKAYVRALERAGLSVTALSALEEYPDSVFIEDAALCLPEGAVMLRPGAPSRTGEPGQLATDLASLGHEVHLNDSDGFIDGGDILVTDSVILVGLSSRTNRAGFEWLKTVVGAWGYAVLAVHTPDHVLHFKSDCCLLDSNTILATSRLAGAECFAPFRVLTVPPGEEAAANSIRLNDKVLVPAGYPATGALLSRENYALETLRVTQAALLDGGLSCMSLRF